MTSPPPPPPEGTVLEELREKQGLSARAAAKAAGISDTWWREVVLGYRKAGPDLYAVQRASAPVLARMAAVVGATPEQLRKAGRGDAADYLEAMRNGDGTEAVTEPEARPLDTAGLSAQEVEALEALIDAMRTARGTA